MELWQISWEDLQTMYQIVIFSGARHNKVHECRES